MRVEFTFKEVVLLTTLDFILTKHLWWSILRKGNFLFLFIILGVRWRPTGRSHLCRESFSPLFHKKLLCSFLLYFDLLHRTFKILCCLEKYFDSSSVLLWVGTIVLKPIVTFVTKIYTCFSSLRIGNKSEKFGPKGWWPLVTTIVLETRT